jgi:hypothetical protein
VEVVSSSLLKSGGPALFQRIHRIEKWGRGIKMILEREPATEIEEVGTALFVARFRRQGLGKKVLWAGDRRFTPPRGNRKGDQEADSNKTRLYPDKFE